MKKEGELNCVIRRFKRHIHWLEIPEKKNTKNQQKASDHPQTEADDEMSLFTLAELTQIKQFNLH